MVLLPLATLLEAGRQEYHKEQQTWTRDWLRQSLERAMRLHASGGTDHVPSSLVKSGKIAAHLLDHSAVCISAYDSAWARRGSLIPTNIECTSASTPALCVA